MQKVCTLNYPPSLQKNIRFKGAERTHSTDSDGKLVFITTKSSKDAAIITMDNLIEKGVQIVLQNIISILH